MPRIVLPGSLLMGIIIVFYILSSDSFFVDNLEVTGLHYLDKQEIIRYSGFVAQNAFRINKRQLRRRLLSHPWIREVSITWSWPNQVVATIEERRPLAIVPYQEEWFLLDEEGRLMPSQEGVRHHRLLTVSGLDIEASEQLLSTARLLKQVPEGVLEYLSEWNAKSRFFVTRKGTTVLIGDMHQLQEKFSLMGLILAELVKQPQPAKRVDLRIPKNPVVQY